MRTRYYKSFSGWNDLIRRITDKRAELFSNSDPCWSLCEAIFSDDWEKYRITRDEARKICPGAFKSKP